MRERGAVPLNVDRVKVGNAGYLDAMNMGDLF